MRYSEIITEDDKLISINSLKAFKNMLTYGDVILPHGGVITIKIKDPYEITFPPDFTVYGNISFSFNKEINLYGDLTVYGSVYMFDTTVKSLPEKLHITGNFIFNHSVVLNWPKGMQVDGDIEYVGDRSFN